MALCKAESFEKARARVQNARMRKKKNKKR